MHEKYPKLLFILLKYTMWNIKNKFGFTFGGRF